MYKFEIEKTIEKHYTALPGPIIQHIKPWLDRNLEYEIIKADNAPDEITRGCVFKGREYMIGYSYVYTNVMPNELLNAAEEMHHIKKEDI